MTFAQVAVLHAAPTLAMCGVIWLVQVLVYPSFGAVGAATFRAFHAAHSTRTSFVVLPLMTAELGLAAWLCTLATSDALRTLTFVGAGLVGVIWLSTFLIQVPCHDTLSRGFDATAHRRLVRTNWIRTLAWTARAGLAIVLVSAP